jgi:alpha-methylacyl-CoA racemase
VLSLAEAPRHAHNVARRTFVEVDGVVQPSAAPRFDRTPASVGDPPAVAGEHSIDVLLEAGFTRAEIDALLDAGVVGHARPVAREGR